MTWLRWRSNPIATVGDQRHPIAHFRETRGMSMNRRSLIGIGLYVLLIPVASVTAHGGIVVIDSFEDRPAGPGFPLVGGYLYDPGVIMTSYPHVIGGRGMLLSGTTPGEGSDAVSVDIDNTATPSFLEYNSFDPTFGGELEIDYGASEVPYTGSNVTQLGLNVNPATDYLQLNFLAYNYAGDQDMTVVAFLNSVPNPLVSPTPTTVTGMLGQPGLQVLDFPLSSLTGDTLEFASFVFQAPPGTDFELSSVELITSVPEPGSAWLLGIALPLFFERKFRRVTRGASNG
jgi:hypothetical protein